MKTTYHKCSLFFSKIFRIGFASIRGFKKDDCFSKASALTYYSLLSIVPVLAVGFGIAKGFGFEKTLESEFMQVLSDQHEIAEKLIEFTYKTLETTQSGIIAFVGLIVLFWSVLKLLASIEYSFNAIWKHASSRTFSRRFSDYFSMMLFFPLFFITASSLFVFVVSEIVNASKVFGSVEIIDSFFSFILYLLPFIVSWFLFSIIYYTMPNTKVIFSAALIAGIIAGTAYQLIQWIYIRFQIGLAGYGAIYGSFAALPLFLVWINMSWIIALAGAEIAYHIENDLPIDQNPNTKKRHIDKRILGFLLMQHCIQKFNKGLPPPTVYQLALELGVTTDIVRSLLRQLLKAELLVEVNWRNGHYSHYQPRKPPADIHLKNICAALDHARHEYYTVNDNPQIDQIIDVLTEMDERLTTKIPPKIEEQ